MNLATKEKLFDVRLVERNLSRGLIAKGEHEKLLEQLPDDEQHGEALLTDDPPESEIDEVSDETSDEE